MQSSLPSSHFRVAVLFGTIALGLGFVPPVQVAMLKTHLLDALKPGLECLHITQTRWTHTWEQCSFRLPRLHPDVHAEEASQLAEEVDRWQHRYRQLEITNAQLHRQLQQLKENGSSPYPSRPGRPLVDVELLEASVLNRDKGAIWQAERIINRGSRDGLVEADLVLDGKEPLIDQGKEANLATGHPVYSGRCVVGRLANVGRVVSTIQKVTDENYRGFAQLIRKTEKGFVFGAEGVIEGQGQKLCRLRYISSTQPVEVGDDVYTGDHDGTQPYPMYYGRVVKAELTPGEQEWSIWVEPTIQELDCPTVTVLRTQLDRARTLTN